MINLNNVTLLSIADGNYTDKTIRAMKHCLTKINFYETIFLTNNKQFKDNDINTIYFDKKLDHFEYSVMCIKKINKYISSDYVLLIQWDGFIIDEKLWSNTFLNYDYIGAPWNFLEGCNNRIGNGGFSLRSKKFLEVSSSIEYTPYDDKVHMEVQKIGRPIAPEDWFLCVYSYEKLIDNGIKFPSLDIAYRFSVEYPSSIKKYNPKDLNTYQSFGFHGSFNTDAMKLLEIR